jgi:hypothetical protein
MEQYGYTSEWSVNSKDGSPGSARRAFFGAERRVPTISYSLPTSTDNAMRLVDTMLRGATRRLGEYRD